MAAGVLHDLVVDLVLVPGQRVLGREDSAALAAVKLGRLLVDGLNVSFQGLGVTVNLDKHVVKSKTLTMICIHLPCYTQDTRV